MLFQEVVAIAAGRDLQDCKVLGKSHFNNVRAERKVEHVANRANRLRECR
jgi:hypothetical protein